MKTDQEFLEETYKRRFRESADYRNKVWKILCAKFFSQYVRPTDTVLDLGCGYGEFINNAIAKKKYGMDLNPATRKHLTSDVEFFEQDCSAVWPVKPGSLDIVFTSNFFEHLPSKTALSQTLSHAFTALKPGGRIIALGPNIRYEPGRYWDFFDHYVPLSDASLAEAMELAGFKAERVVGRFLPYTMVNAPKYPLFLLKIYLKLPFLWWVKGRQFLVIAKKG